ncbi:hypothetical protein EJB05_01591, partial [Eragrostis curvula]
MSRRTSAISGGSSSTPRLRKELPIVDCPHCRSPVLRLVSKKPESYGRPFFKCENNDQTAIIPFATHSGLITWFRAQDDPYSCGFYKWENEYEDFLRRRNLHPEQVFLAARERAWEQQLQAQAAARNEVEQPGGTSGLARSVRQVGEDLDDLRRIVRQIRSGQE